MERVITDFVFFSAADVVLFHRGDAESAVWRVHELLLKATFPYDSTRPIERGMRIGFTDFDGVFQCYEIRQVKTTEPDHSQQITAEHIAVAELTDVHLPLYSPGAEVTASVAVKAVLQSSGWACGSVASVVAKATPDLSMTSVWAALCDLRELYGMRIEPVVTVDDHHITGRSLRFVSMAGVWRGVRLSLNKNIQTAGVTYDDTDLITAIYGYGASTSNANETPTYVTLKDASWTQTADHPAKPAGQMYLENPAAKAKYGRNGKNRFGFYSNPDARDAQTLLRLCWEALQQQDEPTVSIDLKLISLARMGYEWQDIRLGDKVVIDIEPIGAQITDTVNTLEIDLLDERETVPGIGAFVPDIVYINKAQAEGKTAKIGGGGRGSGATKNKNIWTEFYRDNEQIHMSANRITEIDHTVTTQGTAININSERILLTASETEWDNLKQSGTRLYSSITQNASGVETLVKKTAIDKLGDGETLYSKISQNAESISLKVSKGDVATQLKVECGNVSITNGNLVVDGYVTASQLSAVSGKIDNFTSGVTEASSIRAKIARLGTGSGGAVYIHGQQVRGYSVTDTSGVVRQVWGYTL